MNNPPKKLLFHPKNDSIYFLLGFDFFLNLRKNSNYLKICIFSLTEKIKWEEKETAHPNKIVIKWQNLTFGNDCVTQTKEKSHTHTHTHTQHILKVLDFFYLKPKSTIFSHLVMIFSKDGQPFSLVGKNLDNEQQYQSFPLPWFGLTGLNVGVTKPVLGHKDC